MLVDHERVLLDLKAEIASKGSHGQRDLLSLIARLEVAHRIEEGLPERALRQYGTEFFNAVVLRSGEARMDRNPWFSGFADGEACFGMYRSGRGLAPLFQISLRWDDRAVLEAASEVFGGRLYHAPARGERSPVCQYTVADKASLTKLVAYFDAFPLLAKKARDYAVWRKAVLVYCEHGCNADELPDLLEELRQGRAFRDSPDDALRPAPEDPRVGLPDGSDDRLAAGEAHPVPKEDTDGSKHRTRDARGRPAPAAPRAHAPA